MTNGLTVAAPFGGGGVSDVTYDTANAEEMQVLISGGLGEAETGGPEHQHRAEVGRQPVPRQRVLQHVGRLGDVEQSRRPVAQLRHYAAAHAPHELGHQLQPRWSDQARSSVVLCQRSRLGQRLRRRWHLRQPVRRRCLALGLLGRPVHRITYRRKDERSSPARLTAQLTPRNRVTFSHDYQRRCGGSTLREDGDGCRQSGGRLDRLRSHVRCGYGVAGDVPRLPQLPVQHDAGHVFGAASAAAR